MQQHQWRNIEEGIFFLRGKLSLWRVAHPQRENAGETGVSIS